MRCSRSGSLATAAALAIACAPGTDTIQTGSQGQGAGPFTDASAGPSSSSSSTTASGSGGMGGDAGAGGCNFASPNTCQTAQVLMEIDGDQGTEVATLMGVGSRWLQIKIVEASNGPAVVRYNATIASAMGTDYDL